MVKAKSRNIPKSIPTKRQQELIEEAQRTNQEIQATLGEDRPAILDAPVVSLSKPNAPVTNAGTVHQRKHNPLKGDRKRFSSLKKLNKAQTKSYAERMEEKEERARMKAQEESYKALIKNERDEERRKAEQRKKQKEENERKGMVVQKITNTKKLKKLTPKQMRQIIKM